VIKLKRLNNVRPNNGLVQFPADTYEYFQLLRNASNVVLVTNGGVLSKIYKRSQNHVPGSVCRLGLRMP